MYQPTSVQVRLDVQVPARLPEEQGNTHLLDKPADEDHGTFGSGLHRLIDWPRLIISF